MKRHGNLWGTLTSYPHLLESARLAALGKRTRENVARYFVERERYLIHLQDHLLAKTWVPGDFRTFEIYEPKQRTISAAPFRDRVVHHALTGVLTPIYERCFIPDSYANRVGKGTHAAILRAMQLGRRHRYVWKADISRYFDTIDRGILKGELRRKIKDKETLWLADRIIDHPEPIPYPGEVVSPAHCRGLPLGNQTSQFFANVYLNPFDHWVMNDLRLGGYVRFVDDFLIFAESTDALRRAQRACAEMLATLRLSIHPKKSVISRTGDGIRFLGYRVWPTYRRLTREAITRIRRRTKRLLRDWEAGRLSEDEANRKLASWLGYVGQARGTGLLLAMLNATETKQREARAA